MAKKILSKAEKIVAEYTEKPENFLSVQTKAEKALTKCTKSLYDLAKQKTSNAGNALPQLLVDGFDIEQIYQQLELQNEPAMAYFLTKCSKILVNNNQNQHSLQHLLAEHQEDENLDSDSDSEEENEDKTENISDDEDDDDDDSDEESKKTTRSKKNVKTSEVDDVFFKLDECEEFIEDAMRREKAQEKSEENSDEESVDYFNDDDESEEDENDDGRNKKSDARYAKFKDFFDPPAQEEKKRKNPEMEEEEENEENEIRTVVKGKDEYLYESNPEKLLEPFKKKVKFNLADDDENKESQEPETTLDGKSTFDQREERLRKRIQQLEDENMKEKPWQLKGEVAASDRPENALLEEYLETEVTSRPAPIMTEQTTFTLEQVIKQRIKDKAFDDVEKKFKPVETPMEYKKKLVLDQEKSKKSLAEIYESEYIKQREAKTADENDDELVVEEPKEHKEIREMMHALFNKLDALSNFHYTPKPINPEVKIISNLPVVSMEEVAPVATSDATMLAPEEIKAKARGDTMAAEERTKTDKKRSRRRKKLRQGEIRKAKEARPNLPSKPGKKAAQKEKAALIDKVSKARNVSKMSESVHKMAKSSTAFFGQLQDQAQMAKRKPEKSTKKHDLSAVKLKL